MVLQGGTGKWTPASSVFFPTATLAAPANQSSLHLLPSLYLSLLADRQPRLLRLRPKPPGESAGGLASNLILGFSVTDVLQTWGKGWKKFTAWFWSRPKAQRWGIVALPFVFIIICSGAMSGHKESGGSDGGGACSASAIKVSTRSCTVHTTPTRSLRSEVQGQGRRGGWHRKRRGEGLSRPHLCLIEIGDEFEVFHVECYFDDKHAREIANLRPGQSITVLGTCEGKTAW